MREFRAIDSSSWTNIHYSEVGDIRDGKVVADEILSRRQTSVQNTVQAFKLANEMLDSQRVVLRCEADETSLCQQLCCCICDIKVLLDTLCRDWTEVRLSESDPLLAEHLLFLFAERKFEFLLH